VLYCDLHGQDFDHRQGKNPMLVNNSLILPPISKQKWQIAKISDLLTVNKYALA
jgi:hypothetical protein